MDLKRDLTSVYVYASRWKEIKGDEKRLRDKQVILSEFFYNIVALSVIGSTDRGAIIRVSRKCLPSIIEFL